MKKLFKPIALVCAALTLVSALTGCSRNNHTDNTDPTALPTALPTAPIADTSDPTENPIVTPDPAKYALGEDGYFEDEFLTAYWPSFLKFIGSSLDNTVMYQGYPEGSEKKVTFSYTWDTGGSFEQEVAGFDFNSYQEYLTKGMNLYFYLEEMNYIQVDGHETLRAVFNYNPPDEPEHYVRILQYTINVNGWILGLGFTTQDETFPPECVDSISTIKFKPGY